MGLIMTVFLIAILGIIATALVLGANLNLRLTHNLADSKRAFYSAEAGIEYARYLLDIGGIPEDITTEDQFEVSDVSYFTLEFRKDVPEEGQITVISSGYSQKNESKLKVVFKNSPPSFLALNKFMVSDGDIVLRGNVEVEGGDILTNGNIDVVGSAETGETMAGAVGEINGIPEEYIIDDFSGLDFPEIDWNAVARDNDGVVEITGQGNDRRITLDNDPEMVYYYPEPINESNLSILGKGTLFVDGYFKIAGGHSQINDAVVIVTREYADISGNQGGPYQFALISEGDISISANLDFRGSFISRGSIDISGGTSITFDNSLLEGSQVDRYSTGAGIYEIISWEEID